MEVRLVWMSFVLGCILMASYDLLRWFRFFVPHGLVWTGIEEGFFYWICAAVMTFLLLFYEKQRDRPCLCDRLRVFRHDLL